MTKIVARDDSFCAVASDGRAHCWGSNGFGQLGAPFEQSVLAAPAIVKGLAGITHLDINHANACARVVDGGVYCWGEPGLVGAGTLPTDGGDPPSGSFETPIRQDAVPPAESLSIGSTLGLSFACVTLGDGSLTCWGGNYFRELGRGATEFALAPPARAALLTQPVASVIAGSMRTFVITPEGNVLSWGSSTQFRSHSFLLGRDTSEDPNELPTVVPLLSLVRGIATGSTHSCAVAGRFVQCWGANADGQLGRGSYNNASYAPARTMLAAVTDAEDVDASKAEPDVPVQAAVGKAHSCAVLGSGRVYCWGNAGDYRVLGTRVKAYLVEATPLRIEGLSGPAVGLAASSTATCALLRSGAVECWGANDLGQLGIGAIDDEPHPSPSPVSFSP